MSPDEPKREAERVPLPGQVTGEVTVFQPMTILNMSDRGMQIESGVSLHNDSLHEFRLSLNDRSVIVKGRVAYCQIGDLKDGGVLYRCGIEFVEPTPHAVAAIVNFVAVHKPIMPPPVIDAEINGDS